MPRGRRPKPEGLKRTQGFPSHTKKAAALPPADDSAHEVGQYDPPAKLTGDERRVWNQLVPLLRERRFVQVTDLRTLCRYCKFLSLFEAIAPRVTVRNVVKVTKSEHVTMERLNKHFLAMLHLDKRLENLEDRFGLNPAARQTLLARAAASLPRLPLPETPQPRPGGEQPAQPPRQEQPRPPSPIGMGRTVN